MASRLLRNSAISLAFVLCAALADTGDRPTGNRTTPPTLDAVSPAGIARGTTVELTVEGLNLAKASAIYFSDKAVTGRILRVKELPDLPDVRLGSNGTPSTVDVGPLPPRNQVTVEVEVSPDAEIGPVRFRLLTPLGTSPEGRFLIEPYYGEAPDREPNDTPEQAFETFLPAILTGAISKPGDVDYYRLQVKAGQEVSFYNGAMLIGSSLQPVVTILDSGLDTIAEFGTNGGTSQVMFAHRFATAGTYYIRISDFQHGGRASATYRIIAGEFPLVLSAWPLGLQTGTTSSLKLAGFHVAPEWKLQGKPAPESADSLTLRPEHAFNQIKVALGAEPEIASQGGTVAWPVTINGRIASPGAVNRYRFNARKGEEMVFEVNAQRLGSSLDSYLEVLDSRGNSIERAVVRPVWETAVTLRDHDSSGRGIRILAWDNLHTGDYAMVGAEIIRVAELPLSPDADCVFEGFGGQRTTFFDTTAEAHAIDSPLYKVQIYPPGTKLSPNGLPVAHLYFRNDDGGPGYGKDSLLHFTAPADGEYSIAIRDVQGLGGDSYPYRLTIRRPHPDYRLTVSPRNPNVPAGGAVPVTVTAFRTDGFEGAIDVRMENLPAGLHAAPSTIGKDQISATLTLVADAAAALPGAVSMKVIGQAAPGTQVASPEDPLQLIALMPHPDIVMTPETREVTLAPGGTAEITVSITRQNGFGGRVPVEVRNLPPRVRVLDVGLNGVLIGETESRRTFTLEALPSAEPVDQLIYLSGFIETRSGQQNSYASPDPVRLHVKAK